jgi:glycosyltransferase involved in cell wall biosynthesis
MLVNKKKFIIVTTVSDSMPFFKGQINILKEYFNVELVSSAGIYMDEMCSLHNVTGHTLEMKREISIFNDFLSLIKLIVLFFRIKPYIVHGNTPKASLLSMIAAWITRVPKRIYYVHGLRYYGEIGKKRKLLMFLEKVSCYFSTHVFAVSEGVKEALKKDSITEKEILIIWNGSVNGIDLEYFDPEKTDVSTIRNLYGIDEKDFVFGFIGRFVRDKGVNELVGVFKTINKIHKNTKLLLVGTFENHLDPLNKETIYEIESNKNIINAGFQKDVRSFLSSMNVFTFPSYREGLGLVLMEAGAMNIPSISSDITGCREIIFNNINGLLINSKDQQDLFDKMLYSIENPVQINEMAKKTRTIVKDKFEQKELWKKSLEMYVHIAKN